MLVIQQTAQRILGVLVKWACHVGRPVVRIVHADRRPRTDSVLPARLDALEEPVDFRLPQIQKQVQHLGAVSPGSLPFRIVPYIPGQYRGKHLAWIPGHFRVRIDHVSVRAAVSQQADKAIDALGLEGPPLGLNLVRLPEVGAKIDVVQIAMFSQRRHQFQRDAVGNHLHRDVPGIVANLDLQRVQPISLAEPVTHVRQELLPSAPS